MKQVLSGSQFFPFSKQLCFPMEGFDYSFLVNGLPQFKSSLIAVTGISTGDEGKGRTIPDVARILRAMTGRRQIVGLVYKVNGGANSGHTADGLKLNLLPAGVGDPDVQSLGVGRGVVADPLKFLWEGIPLEQRGYRVFDRLIIDRRAMVSDITHRILDKAQEAQRDVPRGSTGRGISPAFSDEVLQHVIHFNDFAGDFAAFRTKMTTRIRRAEREAAACSRVSSKEWQSFFDSLTEAEVKANSDSILQGVFSRSTFDFTRFCGSEPCTFNVEEVVKTYWEAGQQLRRNLGSISQRIFECQNAQEYVVGEFGQAYWLDKRHGFSPNVTASHTNAPEYFQSAEIPVQPIHNVGVCKAYDTKVGTHVFLTEVSQGHPLGSALRHIEFGTTTGRQRMVGWFDAVEKGHVLRHSGFDDMVINKIDVLTKTPALSAWDGVLQICSAYRLPSGEVTRKMPDDDSIRRKCQPVYTLCPGWSEDVSDVRSFRELPVNAQRYLATCYAATVVAAYGEAGWANRDVPLLRLVGVGPDSSQVILDAPVPGNLMAMAHPLQLS